MASGSGTALKIIILGNRGYVLKKFHEQYVATYGALFVTKEILIGDAPVTSQIWDTAGQDRFQSFCTPFYRMADCCILLYDVNVGNSFDTLDSWHDALFNQMNPQDRPLDLPKLPLILLGNKVDVDGGNSRVVSIKRAENWCASKGNIPYFETSAKDNFNVDAVFVHAARLALNPDLDITFQETASDRARKLMCLLG
ncbi:unnamed protein product [Musa textilis]